MPNEMELVERLCSAMEVYQAKRDKEVFWYYDWMYVAIQFGEWLERRKNERLEP